MKKDDCSGMTLIEVMLATVILGTSLVALMMCISVSMRVYSLAYELQKVPWVLGMGEMEYPLYDAPEPLEDLVVDPDSQLVDGFTFSRDVEEDEDEDGLYVVRTYVKWGDAEDEVEEIVRYIYKEL